MSVILYLYLLCVFVLVCVTGSFVLFFQAATSIATAMVQNYGMSEKFGLRTVNDISKVSPARVN